MGLSAKRQTSPLYIRRRSIRARILPRFTRPRFPDSFSNNDSYKLTEVTDIIGKLEWITDDSYSNIKLYIAKIQSLLLLKVRAIHFAGLVPRITDQTDVLDILAFLGIHTIEEVKQNPLTKDIEKKYPRCFDFLKKTEKW